MRNILHNIINWIFDVGFRPIKTIRYKARGYCHSRYCGRIGKGPVEIIRMSKNGIDPLRPVGFKESVYFFIGWKKTYGMINFE